MKVPSFAVLADYVNVTADGKLNIMGIFDVIRAPSFPVIHPTMRLVLRLQGSPSERGSIKSIEIKMLDADGKQLLEIATTLSIPEAAPLNPDFPQIIELNGIPFMHPGAYSFSILVNGEEKATVPFTVVPVETAA